METGRVKKLKKIELNSARQILFVINIKRGYKKPSLLNTA